MESFDNFQKLRYFKCNMGGLHENENLNFICIDHTCKNYGLICSICKEQYHAKHQTIPFKFFLLEIQKNLLNHDIKNINYDEYIEQIQQIQKTILFSLKESIESLSAKVKYIEEQLIQTYSRVQQQIIFHCTIRDKIPKEIESII